MKTVRLVLGVLLLLVCVGVLFGEVYSLGQMSGAAHERSSEAEIWQIKMVTAHIEGRIDGLKNCEGEK